MSPHSMAVLTASPGIAAVLALMADLDAGGKKAPLEAQRSWLNFRANNTRYVSSTISGSFGASMASQTFVTMTADRAAELEEFARP